MDHEQVTSVCHVTVSLLLETKHVFKGSGREVAGNTRSVRTQEWKVEAVRVVLRMCEQPALLCVALLTQRGPLNTRLSSSVV